MVAECENHTIEYYHNLDKMHKIFPDLDFNLEYATNEDFFKKQVKEKAMKIFQDLKDTYRVVAYLQRCMIKRIVTLEHQDLTNQNMIPVYILDQFLECFPWTWNRYPNWKNLYENNLVFFNPVLVLGKKYEGDVMFWENLMFYASRHTVGFTKQNVDFNAIDHPEIWRTRFHTLMEKIYTFKNEETQLSTKYYFEIQYYLNKHYEEWRQITKVVHSYHKKSRKSKNAEYCLHLKIESIGENIYKKRIDALNDYFMLQPKYDETFFDDMTKTNKALPKLQEKENKIQEQGHENKIHEEKKEKMENEESFSYESCFDTKNPFFPLCDAEMKVDFTRTETEKEEKGWKQKI
jgi:hypothetical protein